MRTYRTYLTLLLILSYSLIHGQWSDDFSDGDFTTDPSWSGDDGLFIVNGAQELQLFAPAETDEAYLSTASDIISEAIWEFRIRLDFNPSSSNQAFIYLVSDQADLEGPLQGYVVRVGNSEDEVSLYRQDGTDLEELIDGVDDLLDVDPVNLTVRVTRDADGNWELFSDLDNSGTFNSEGVAFDDTYDTATFFGWRCDYTSTRAEAFFLDDISVTGEAFMDEVPPELTALEVLDGNSLLLQFNEPMEATTLEDLGNYEWMGENPINAIPGPQEVILTFSTEFPQNEEQQLSYQSLTDLAGNQISAGSEPFTFVVFGIGLEGSVIINELFPDPTPSIGLPDAEYVELYNPSDSAYQLTNWVLLNSGTEDPLGSGTIAPGEYVILCDADDAALFEDFGRVVSVSGLTALTNGGDDLILRNAQGSDVDMVTYSDEWYGGSPFDDGGYSLERINPNLPCSTALNWTVSSDPQGGTPGTQNSLFILSDDDPPGPLSLEVLDDSTLILSFDEAMDEGSVILADYTLDGGVLVTVAFPLDLNTVQLDLEPPLTPGQSYTLQVDGVEDCSGNIGLPFSFDFLVPEVPEAGDVLINEVMADPTPSNGLPELEYVELYNRSDKVLSLKDWTFVNTEVDKLLPDTVLLPGDYIVLCDAEEVQQFESFGRVLGIESFSSLSNLGDSLSLLSSDGMTMDIVSYNTSWYNDPERDGGGYSLERINPFLDCTGEENWRASLAEERGTPAKENSVFDDAPDVTPPSIVHCFAQGPTIVRIRMDEGYDADRLSEAEFSLDTDITVTAVLPVSRTDFRVLLSAPLLEEEVYTMTISGIFDCSGNEMATGDCPLGTPSEAQDGDIIINELLFNPRTGGSDFIELYNRSPRAIDLRLWTIAERNSGDIGDISPVVEELYILLPGEFLVLTDDPQDIRLDYPLGRSRRYVSVDDLPSMPDDMGTIVLRDPILNVQDEFSYSEDYHFALIDDVNGVSLERVDYERLTDDPTNWHSAAGNVGWATPGYENSQLSPANASDQSFDIDPEVFSPDNDGFQDLLNITYKLDSPGQVANITIFDRDGRRVRLLVQNELLSTEGVISWDGITDEGGKARIGVYVVLIELFDLEGDVSSTKKTCVVAGRF